LAPVGFSISGSLEESSELRNGEGTSWKEPRERALLMFWTVLLRWVLLS